MFVQVLQVERMRPYQCGQEDVAMAPRTKSMAGRPVHNATSTTRPENQRPLDTSPEEAAMLELEYARVHLCFGDVLGGSGEGREGGCELRSSLPGSLRAPSWATPASAPGIAAMDQRAITRPRGCLAMCVLVGCFLKSPIGAR